MKSYDKVGRGENGFFFVGKFNFSGQNEKHRGGWGRC